MSQTRSEISKLHQLLKTTFIYVTHDQTEVMTMGTRIAIMNDGTVQQLNTPQMLYDRPANLLVVGFSGSPATRKQGSTGCTTHDDSPE